MKIGIILYSQTGNTRQVVKRIEQDLIASGNQVTIDEITVADIKQASSGKPQLVNIPKADNYDRIILGAPIQGFSLCAPMKQYINNHMQTNVKEVSTIITQQFPFSWMGGSNGIRQMKALCAKKDITLTKSSIVHWSAKDREQEILEAIKNLT